MQARFLIGEQFPSDQLALSLNLVVHYIKFRVQYILFTSYRFGSICAESLMRATAVNVNPPDFGRYNMTG